MASDVEERVPANASRAPGEEPDDADAQPASVLRSLLHLAPRRGNARGIAYYLAGSAAPALLALVCIPRIARALGAERFGILALAWTVVGYAAFLHLGLGRAVAQGTAARGARSDELRPRVWTALLMTFTMGITGGTLVFLLAPSLVRLLDVPAGQAAEATAAFRVLGLVFPLTVTQPVLTGVLEARRRFGRLNAALFPGALVTFVGPVVALEFTRGLVPLVWVLAAGRALTWCVVLTLCLREAPELRAGPAFHHGQARALLRYGGWTTVSAVVNPLLVYLDRFVIGAALSAAAVAYYASAQEVVLRMGMVSGAVVGVLFPAFAGVPGHTGVRLAHLLESGVDAVVALVLPLALLLAAGAEPLLHLWLGREYAAEGALVLAWLSFGLVVNGLAKLPSALLQGVGRPDLTARLHLVELPAFVLVLGVCVWQWGMGGAAVAWVARVSADALALYWITVRRVPECRRAAVRAAMVAGCAAAGVGALRLAASPLLRVGLLAVAGAALAWALGRILHRRAGGAPGAPSPVPEGAR
ncbi:MAG TPA: oligosaccharide flippase family protein [Longimicrobium sp.]|nr:oligosaccharide flippase family protein [Longimicrobium sp.]